MLMRMLNNLRRYDVKAGKSVPLILNMIPGDPVLHLEHLGESNHRFINDKVRGTGTDAVRASALRGTSDVDARQKVRDENRETVARYCVHRVEGFFYDDAAGNPDPTSPVPNTPEGFMQVIRSLPDWIFDIVLAFVVNAANFMERVVAGDAADVAKKS
jgi:hypothetical protein